MSLILTFTHLQVIRLEDQVDQLQTENNKLSGQAQQDADELLRLAERVQQQELDLTISQEKHRTCQKEVANRDQMVLRLQGELDTTQQQYQGSVEEVKGNGITDGSQNGMDGYWY